MGSRSWVQMAKGSAAQTRINAVVHISFFIRAAEKLPEHSDFPVPFIYLFVLKVLKWLFTPKSNIIIFPLACFVIYPSRMF